MKTALLLGLAAISAGPALAVSSPPCEVQSSLHAGNTFIVWNGATSHCTPAGPSCIAGEPITFQVGTFGVDAGCLGPVVAEWNYGDGTTNARAGLGPIVHTYTGPRPYTVTVNVQAESGSLQLTAPLSAVTPAGTLSPPCLALLFLSLSLLAVFRLRS